MSLSTAWLRSGGRLALMLGATVVARSCFTRLLAQLPHDTHALATLAHLSAAEGEMTQALLLQQRAVDLAPGDAAAWYNLGFLLDQAGQCAQRAEHAFRQALAINDRLDQAWYGLGRALERQNRLDEAVRAFQENTARQPFSPHAWVELARLQARRGELEKACQTVQHLGSFEPKVALGLARELGVEWAGAA
ncbi:tetratricopeptide repeat protein [Hydrogenophaga aquatica]